MQILRCLSLACAMAIISSPLLLRADNEAQIRARAALEQKMDQMETESVTSTPPSTVTNQPPAPAPKKSKAKPKPAPVEKPTPPPVQPPAVTESAPPVSTPPPPAPKPARTTDRTSSANASEFAPAPATTSDNTQTDERLQNALQQRISETPSAPAEQQTTPTSHKKPTKVVVNNPVPPTQPSNPTPAPPQIPSTLPPLPGPPSPISASKQQQLDAILQQYKADQITPQQYHEQRAKILAEP